MVWNCEPCVLSADAQFNGAEIDGKPIDHVESIEHFMDVYRNYKSKYQVALSSRLSEIMSKFGFNTNRRFESLPPYLIKSIKLYGEEIIGKPAEFYRAIMSKSDDIIKLNGRDNEFMEIIRNNWKNINDIYKKAFSVALDGGREFDHIISSECDNIFNKYDVEMQNMLKSYLKQKPVSQLLSLDDEVVEEGNKENILQNPYGYFTWLEGVRYVTTNTFNDYGLDFLEMLTGKGYHFLSEVPLHSKDEKAGINRAMLELMAIGGPLQAETVDKLVTVKFESRKGFPTPLLAQVAYQGAKKLEKFIQISMASEMRKNLAEHGYDPFINYSDTHHKTISLDLTSLLRQSNMAVLGSSGSVYGKVNNPDLVRIPRSNSMHNKDYFKGDIGHMLHTRANRNAAWHHLRESNSRIPDGSKGILNLISDYKRSKIKQYDDYLLDWIIDENYVKYMRESNYEPIRKRCGWIMKDVYDDDKVKDPKALQYIFSQMHNTGFVPRDMLVLMYALYTDPCRKGIFEHEDKSNKYSKAEWAKWPSIILPGL